MNTLERLKAFFESQGIATGTAEKACGFGNATLRNAFESGKGIGSDKLEKILSVYPGLSSEWLLRGIGSMLIGKGKAVELEQKIALMSKGRPNKDAAYDVILSMVDMVSKTYDFFGGGIVLTDKEREDKMMDILNG